MFRLLIAYSRTFVECKCALIPRRPHEYEVAFGISFTVVVTENVHQAAALLADSWVNWASRAQAKGLFLGCGLEWNVPGKTNLGLVPG